MNEQPREYFQFTFEIDKDTLFAADDPISLFDNLVSFYARDGRKRIADEMEQRKRDSDYLLNTSRGYSGVEPK